MEAEKGSGENSAGLYLCQLPKRSSQNGDSLQCFTDPRIGTKRPAVNDTLRRGGFHRRPHGGELGDPVLLGLCHQGAVPREGHQIQRGETLVLYHGHVPRLV